MLNSFVRSTTVNGDFGEINIPSGTIMMYVDPLDLYLSPPAGWEWYTKGGVDNQFASGNIPYSRVRVRGHNGGENARPGSCNQMKGCVGLGEVKVKKEMEPHNHRFAGYNNSNYVKRFADGGNIFVGFRNLKPSFGIPGEQTTSSDYSYASIPPSTSQTFLEPPSRSVTFIKKL